MPQELHDHTFHMEVANELLRVTLALLRVRERDDSLQQSLKSMVRKPTMTIRQDETKLFAEEVEKMQM